MAYAMLDPFDDPYRLPDPNPLPNPNQDPVNAAPSAPPTTEGTTADTTPNNGTPGHTDLTAEQYVAAWRQQHPNIHLRQSDPTGWDVLAKDMNAVGFNATLDSRPDGMHKGIMLDGNFVKLTDGNDNPIYQVGGDQGGGSSTTQTSTFNYPDFTPPSWTLPDYTAPGPFSYDAYQPLTSDTFRSAPGYEFNRNEMLRAVTNDASAKGILKTGGTLKALESYAGGLADQNFQNAEGQNERVYNMNRGNAADVYDRGYRNNLTDYMTRYNGQADAYNRSANTYGINFGTAATSHGINASDLSSLFGRQLSLYDIATRDLPKYTPSVSTNTGASGSTAY